MAEVRKLEVNEVESRLRSASEAAEHVRRLQEEKEALLKEFERERRRFSAGEIAKDVFEDLRSVDVGFKAWLRESDSGLFCFMGKPGSGKSTLM